MSLADDALHLVASVTDLQLYGDDHITPDVMAIERMNADFARAPAFVCVGLSRSFMRPGDTVERHWLQVNTVLFDGKGLETKEGAIADQVVETLADLPNPLSLTMLTHLLRGSHGPATSELVSRYSPRHVGLLEALTFGEARDLVDFVCRTDRRIEILGRTVSLQRA